LTASLGHGGPGLLEAKVVLFFRSRLSLGPESRKFAYAATYSTPCSISRACLANPDQASDSNEIVLLQIEDPSLIQFLEVVCSVYNSNVHLVPQLVVLFVPSVGRIH
jgi:hypothetical protein